ncbi:MAG TPA: AAA family ATPase, partial [Streptosporangiaceae bacterium]|nr:AAA family ATPase [Streptosporangiaceae bacterium]
MGGDAAQVMVGRDRELARVTGLFNDALAGRGRLVLCTGEAGIGKTRLAEELAAAATARGVAVAWARAADRGSSPPYGLWRLVLAETAVGSGSAADLWPAGFGAAGLGAESSVAQRFALFADVRGRLAQAASRSGLVLVLDDLQWADEASAVLLVEVVRQLRGMRILAFATYRDSPEGVLAGLSAEANAERVDLHGLPAEAVGDLLLAAGLEASRDRARRVHAETGGNPFLVRELARTLAGPPGSSVPGRVLEATAYRLTQLSDEARDVLQAAAVAGNSFSAGVVAKMLDRSVLSLLGPLSECAAAGFLVAGDRPGDQRFSHALVSSAVVARLSAEEQRRLHAAAA